MKFEDVFKKKKPIMAMLHLKGDSKADIFSRAEREADMLFEYGVDAIIVEDYFGDEEDVRSVLRWLQKERADYCYGVNILDQFSKTYDTAEKYGAKFMQVDSICGHLPPEEDLVYAEQCAEYHKKGTVLILGGVRFKYKEVLSGRRLEDDLKLGMERCDAIVVTGAGTGVETDMDKIFQFRRTMADFPLIVGAGLTPDNVFEQLSVGDGAIVGSCLKNTLTAEGEVSRENVGRFMAEVSRLRG
jgi:predicted TIM-barrel enzyme